MEPTNPEFIGTVTPRKPEGGHYYVPEEDDVSDSKVRSEKIVESIVSNNMEQYPTHNFLNEQQAKQLIDSNITAKAAYIAINSILSKKNFIAFTTFNIFFSPLRYNWNFLIILLTCLIAISCFPWL